MNEIEPTQPKTKNETRLKKLLVGSMRWGLVGLIAFGAGALVVSLALYNPARQKLEKADANLIDAKTTISENLDQISALQQENTNLQQDLSAATLHRDVLEALSGVRGASLAVAANDYAGARLLLIQGTEALDSLSGRLGPENKDVFSAIQQSAAQALDDLQADLKSAQPEMDQLVNNLVQLVDNLFPTP